MGFTTDRLRAAAAEYERRHPFTIVEDERLETLPTAFSEGSFLWKDAEWVVRWFARRSLSGTPHPAEDAFRENGYDDLEAAITGAESAETVTDAVERLTALEGVDVPIASAYLQFLDPERYVTLDEGAVAALEGAGSLSAFPADALEAYPSPLEPTAYATYLEAVRAVSREHDLDLLRTYRALSRLGATEK
ncbi:hypothetical protein [Natrononativus amylolyticus]|uniref:hypothetical protein n=1 Tax=Natrononativus amylolyticus TaxID=2963434 RepID=UPI0020CD9F74|nr:hypothetical protein [Natrononativus amylolyticus]